MLDKTVLVCVMYGEEQDSDRSNKQEPDQDYEAPPSFVSRDNMTMLQGYRGGKQSVKFPPSGRWANQKIIVKTGHSVWREIVELVSYPGLLRDGVSDMDNVADFTILNMGIEPKCGVYIDYLVKMNKFSPFSF